MSRAQGSARLLAVLAAGVLTAGGLSAAAPPRKRPPARRARPAPRPFPIRPLAELEATVLAQVNEVRRKHDLEPLKENPKLMEVARDFSRQMAAGRFFSHTSPTGQTVMDRVRAAGLSYRLVGENLFKSVNLADPAPRAVRGWMDSPGHRENILRPGFTETGVGVWRDGKTYYFTQVFFHPL